MSKSKKQELSKYPSFPLYALECKCGDVVFGDEGHIRITKKWDFDKPQCPKCKEKK